jgi:ectoine hydroxylase-related dioxygenase (phytanoyl-CoA dioxygenase family)
MTTLLSKKPQGLTSNGFPLATGEHRIGRLTPTKATEPIEKIREIYKAQGYVWLQGFFERETILEFRRHFFSAFQNAGLLKEGSDPKDGLFSGHENKRVTNKILMEVVRSAAYESFCLQPKLWQFYDAFLQGPSYLHKRKIIRYMNPGDNFTTPAHYDLTYLRAGTDKVCSSWIPLGDIPVEMGGLVYLEGSDALGRKLEAEFAVKNADLSPQERVSAYNKNMTEGGWVGKDLADMAERFDARWLIADYEAGDMVVHSPYMIHAATQNVDPKGRIRLSTDIRYQNVRDEIDARWNNHWSLDDML